MTFSSTSSPPLERWLQGFFGEFATGGGGRIMFLQSAISAKELPWLSLVGEIEGSEKWSVRDLFQREVDTERVTREILPWLEDEEAVKFFNPLTLAVLPFDAQTQRIRARLVHPRRYQVTEEGVDWEFIECERAFRFRYLSRSRGYGMLEWHRDAAKIVAVDGQHRLSALKRFFDASRKGASQLAQTRWSIPVVLCGLFKDGENDSTASALEVIRSMFIYINTKANPPSRTRQILLDDQSVNNVAVQELLEYSHTLDVGGVPDNVTPRLPLLFFDWRGATQSGEAVTAPAALKSIVELQDWMSHYVLGEDRTLRQLRSLGIQRDSDLAVRLERPFFDTETTSQVRQHFNARWLRPLHLLLSGFTPYRSYLRDLSAIEHRLKTSPDVGVQVLSALRFGSHHGPAELERQIETRYAQVVDELTDIKLERIPELLRFDVGMRAIISAYAELVDRRHMWVAQVGLETFTQWFLTCINNAYDGDWFVKYGSCRKLLRHVCLSGNDAVVNYRLRDVPDAFGALLVVVIASYSRQLTDWPSADEWEALWDDVVERRLLKKVLRGFKTELRPSLRDQFSDREELKHELDRAAKLRTRRYAKALRSALSDLASQE